MIVPGPEIDLPGVPDGLSARLRVRVREGDDGTPRQVKDRRQRFNASHGVVLAATTPADAETVANIVRGYPDELRRLVLGDRDSRSLSTTAKTLAEPQRVAVDLARAGVVELVCDVVDGELAIFRRWHLTDAGKHARRLLTREAEWRRSELERELDAIAAQLPLAAQRFLIGSIAQVETAEALWGRRRLLTCLRRLAAALPAEGAPLSVLASETTDDTHGLDRRAPIGELAAGLAAAIGDVPTDLKTAAGWRRAWESVGVAVDGYGCSVLALGLPGRKRHPAGAVLAAGIRHRQPVILTLRALTGGGGAPAVAPPGRRRPGWIFTVENAALVEIAVTEAVKAPVVHSSGVPNTAVRLLLQDAVQQGWRVAVGSDFEWRALEGARLLLEDLGEAAVPWRLSADDYEAATDHDLHRPLAADGTASPWDPRLSERMRLSRRRVTEENRLDVLVADMRSGAPNPRT